MSESKTDLDSSQNTTNAFGTEGYISAAHLSFSIPKKSAWTMNCGNVYYTPNEGKEPNWFHRKMQELILGFKWRKNS